MRHTNTTRQTRNASTLKAIGAKATTQGEGFVEIAILSLAGLTLSVVLIAQGLFPDVLALISAQ